MMLTLPQVRVESADPLMPKVVTDNLEVSHNETEAKDLNIVNVNFRIINFREAHSREPYSIWQQSQTLLSGKSNK